MFREHEVVALRHDVPSEGLAAGDRGTIVYVYDRSHFEVEFMTPDGWTIAVVTLGADSIARLKVSRRRLWSRLIRRRST